MKVIIAGNRDYNDYETLKIKCEFYLQNVDVCEIVSGGAKGADSLGEKYASEKGLKLKVFQADWGKHGKSAGPKRNKEMSFYADALIAFWDGKSKGTKNMIETAKNDGLKVRIILH